MSPRVKVFLNFEAVTPGSNPKPCIQNPEDMTDEMGMFDPNDFDGLKKAIVEVVEDDDGEHYFHFQQSHSYKFDEKQLPHGAIYGRKNKKDDDEEEGSKITTAKLVPIIFTSSKIMNSLVSVDLLQSFLVHFVPICTVHPTRVPLP
jgi:hypothetical protein